MHDAYTIDNLVKVYDTPIHVPETFNLQNDNTVRGPVPRVSTVGRPRERRFGPGGTTKPPRTKECTICKKVGHYAHEVDKCTGPPEADVEVGDVGGHHRLPLEVLHPLPHLDPGPAGGGEGRQQLDHPAQNVSYF